MNTNVPNDKQVMVALASLSQKSMSQISTTAGLNKSTVSRFLRGLGYLSDQGRRQLFDALGAPGGNQLDRSRVHFWRVKFDLEPLQTALLRFFPQGVTAGGVWREGAGSLDLSRLGDDLLYVFYADGVRIVVRRTGLGQGLPNAVAISPKTLNGLRWNTSKKGKDAMTSIPRNEFRRWERGEVTLEEFDELVCKEKQVTWADVQRFAQANGITPTDVYTQLLRRQNRRQIA